MFPLEEKVSGYIFIVSLVQHISETDGNSDKCNKMNSKRNNSSNKHLYFSKISRTVHNSFKQMFNILFQIYDSYASVCLGKLFKIKYRNLPTLRLLHVRLLQYKKVPEIYTNTMSSKMLNTITLSNLNGLFMQSWSFFTICRKFHIIYMNNSLL